jgi:hypothetical protein
MLDWPEAVQGVKSMTDAAQGLLHLIRQLRRHVQSRELQGEIQEKIQEFEQAKIDSVMHCADAHIPHRYAHRLGSMTSAWNSPSVPVAGSATL